MINLFNSQKKKKLLKNTYYYLNQLYQSFFGDIFNELNIERYRPIRDSVGLVMRRFDNNDHPLAYTSKLIMFIQSQVAIKHLRLTSQQQKLMKVLGQNVKDVKLNFVYTSPLDDFNQFLQK